MSKFAHLGKYDTSDATRWIDVEELGSPDGPVAQLCIKPAGESNKGYFNALLLRNRNRSTRVKKGQITVDDIRKNRLEDAELFPKHIITDWRHVIDSDGNEVPFDRSACQELCQALCECAPQVFDRIRDEAGTTEEFYDLDEMVGN